MLPPLPDLDSSLLARLLELRVLPEFVRSSSVRPDTLFSPLRLTREASLRDDPRYVLLRETFCRPDFHEPLCVMGAGFASAASMQG
ncbi:MAG: hypothetical protein SGI92_07355, partial [Bryobacteraceae bacterium]|nr:hypothetical protein [Bryobacteraceae bacterium]